MMVLWSRCETWPYDPPRVVRVLRQGPRLAVDEIVHHDEVLRAARTQIGDCRAQGGLAAGDQHPGDEIDLDLIRADGREQFLGRERLELGCQAGVERSKGGAIHPKAGTGCGHQDTPLRVDVEEGRREGVDVGHGSGRSEEHTSELQSLAYLVCRLLLEKKKNTTSMHDTH